MSENKVNWENPDNPVVDFTLCTYKIEVKIPGISQQYHSLILTTNLDLENPIYYNHKVEGLPPPAHKSILSLLFMWIIYLLPPHCIVHKGMCNKI